MNTNNARAVIQRLLDTVKPRYTDPEDIVAVARALNAARAELAKPEQQGPSLEDLGPLISWLTESATQSADAGRSTDAGMLTWAAQVVGERVDEDATESEPQGPTSDELQTMAAEFAARTPEEFALAVLARWGRPAVTPIPVSERPWEREGWCDAQGRCWVGEPEMDALARSDYPLGESSDFDVLPPEWKLVDPTIFFSSARPIFLLPHWVLPLPATTPTP